MYYYSKKSAFKIFSCSLGKGIDVVVLIRRFLILIDAMIIIVFIDSIHSSLFDFTTTHY
jgi:hypothetical protein